MGFRTVVIKNRSKLDLRMNFLVCRNTEETKIFIPEISYLILESTAISLTTALLSELVKNNVKIIFCDEKHNPESELVGLYNNYNCVEKIKNQICWHNHIKGEVWQEIIRQKILKQSDFLNELGFDRESLMLKTYHCEVQFNDSSNREGHSAKVYFNAIFGMDFARREENFINSALNYGYAVLLSCFNREVVRQGYLTQIGIWHKNEFNYFNLSSDLMEPFRILIDRIVFDIAMGDGDKQDFKLQILENFFNLKVVIDKKQQFIENAISIYCQSVFDALIRENKENIKFYEL